MACLVGFGAFRGSVRANHPAVGGGRFARRGGQAVEVLEHAVDDLAAARLAAGRGLGQDGDEIAGLLGNLAPAGGGRGDEQLLELAAALPQGRLIGLNIGETAADLGRPLLGQPAVLIEGDGLIDPGVFPPCRVRAPPAGVRTPACGRRRW
jgi:hypothetical protein